MQKPLIALALAAATIAFAAPALAMTDGEYRAQRERVKEDFSHRFVNCVDFSGSEKRKCQSDIRKERNTALKDLKADYDSTREGQQRAVTAHP
jgi:major membrane immunogen (membrane-anchored lipoprotein)